MASHKKPDWLHSASSVKIPQYTYRYDSWLPSVYVSPLKLHSATKINVHGVSDSALFRNQLKVRLSPLKSPVLKNSRNKYRRSVVYPYIYKCNTKRCTCCKHLHVCCKELLNLTLMVYNFLLLIILILIEDQLMLFMFYLEKRRIEACNMLAKSNL